MDGGRRDQRRPPAVGVPCLVLLVIGAGLVVAAIVNVVLGHEAGSAALGLAEAAGGAVLITAGVRLYAGRRAWWMASFCLLPATAALQFWDAFGLGDGTAPIMWGIVLPTVAMNCLLLPSTRAYFARSATSATAETPS